MFRETSMNKARHSFKLQQRDLWALTRSSAAGTQQWEEFKPSLFRGERHFFFWTNGEKKMSACKLKSHIQEIKSFITSVPLPSSYFLFMCYTTVKRTISHRKKRHKRGGTFSRQTCSGMLSPVSPSTGWAPCKFTPFLQLSCSSFLSLFSCGLGFSSSLSFWRLL